MSKIIAIIPARGGSQRVPSKNKRLCAGKPLIEWSLQAALDADCFDGIYVSSDDAEILSIAGRLEGVTPAPRPAELAAADTKMMPVLTHFIEEKALSDEDIIVLLQPTSPLRTGQDIKQALQKFQSEQVETLVSVVVCPGNFHPQKLLKMDEDGCVSPFFEDAPPQGEVRSMAAAYGRNGPAILINTAKTLRSGVLYGAKVGSFIMPPERSIDIDEESEFELADLIISARVRP